MTKSKPLCFFGNDNFSLTILKNLYDNNWPINLVVTKPLDSRALRNRKKIINPVIEFAQKNNLKLLLADNLNNDDMLSKISSNNSDIAILASFGMLLPVRIINIFKLGIINVHPSLLPRWRGPSPIESAILSGDNDTGVSLIKLTKKMDSGPIYAKQEIPLNGDETQEYLYEHTSEIGAELLLSQLPFIISKQLEPQLQNDSLATYSSIIKKSEGNINWDQDCQSIERQIRAFHFWPRSHTNIFNRDTIVTKAHISSKKQLDQVGHCFIEDNSIYINCQTGSLVIDKLQPVGHKEMTSAEFIRGYVSRF